MKTEKLNVWPGCRAESLVPESRGKVVIVLERLPREIELKYNDGKPGWRVQPLQPTLMLRGPRAGQKVIHTACAGDRWLRPLPDENVDIATKEKIAEGV